MKKSTIERLHRIIGKLESLQHSDKDLHSYDINHPKHELMDILRKIEEQYDSQKNKNGL
jgi:hypothetical protein